VIEELLAGRWRDPDSSEPVAVPIKSIVIAPSLEGAEAELVGRLGLGRRLALVDDPTTHAVLGARVERALASIATIEHLQLPEHPHADAKTVEAIRRASGSADALVAVGSGTINDLCKQAAHLDRKPYVVFGTAPSMNGYSSANAAITVAGLKKSLQASVPAGVFLDLAVLAEAPKRMIRSGLGDSLCRSTAEADWLLAHALRGTAFRRAPFELLAEDEGPLFAESGALVAGDRAAMQRLARTLVLSGIGMLIAGGSQPASQGEHMIAHYVEMMGPPGLPATFHGEQIGVATLHMARLQQRMLEAGPPRLQATPVDGEDLRRHFGPEVGAACERELSAKALTPEAAARLTERLAREWPSLVERIGRARRPAAELEGALAGAAAPRRGAELGWPADFERRAVWRARQIRNRYTFLDLAEEAGRLRDFAASAV
jgi:glycerol-1-phosphate dehydrogenase [NAD(P)+]